MTALLDSSPHGTIRCSTRALIAGLLLGITSIVPAQAQSQALIGRWITGPEDLADKSGFTAAGTHDGVAVGTVENITFDNLDVPPGFTGSSLNLAGSAAVMVTNSANTDGGFVQTFNNGISNKFSVAFWFKGQPVSWAPMICKNGESAGWAARTMWDSTKACFTIRGSAGNDDPVGNNSTLFTDGNWHHMACTWDGVTGVRKAYVDGVQDIIVTGDTAPMALSPNDHLVIGGRQQDGGGIGAWFTGKFADVRVYNYALSVGEVTGIYNPPTTDILTIVDLALTNRFIGQTAGMDIVIPTAATASGSYTVTLTSTDGAIMGFQGVSGNIRNITFPQGVITTNITLVANGGGSATITASGDTYNSSSVGFTVYAQNPPALVGQWLSGEADYQDKSSYTAGGTHDGFAVGTSAGSEVFVSDVPIGSGQSLSFDGNVAIAITNSANTDGNYQPTFDVNMAMKQSVAFWAKGSMPQAWGNWLGKRGEDGRGYRIGRYGSSDNGSYTLRGTPGSDDVQGTRSVNDTNWHHFAGTWDGATGVRKFYVDGLLQYTVNNDFGPLSMANDSYFVIGGRDRTPNATRYESFYTGQLFDVRLYNYPISEAQVLDLASRGVGVVATLDSIVATTTNNLRITIPSSANASSSVTVYVTNNAPTIADLPGATADVLTIVFAAGATPVTNITVTGLAAGTANYSAGATGLNGSTTTFTVVRTSRTLLGHWFVGNEDYIDYSGWQTNIHNGTSWGTAAFSTDVPPGFTGSSLDLSTAQGAVVIDNSYTAAGAGYTNTFDDVVKNEITIAFWNKGWANGTVPGEWWNTHFVSKNAQDWQSGYSMRPAMRNGDKMDFELGISGLWWGTEPSIASKDTTTWHHYVGTLDAFGKVKTLYVDGKLSQSTNYSGASISMAKNSALVIGGLDKNTGGTDITMQTSCSKFYDVRVYGKALSHYEAFALFNAGATNMSMSGFGYPSLLVGATNSISISLPNGYNATLPFTVYLTNSSPGVVSINGSTAAVIAITFPAGALPFTNVSYSIIGSGTANLSLGGAGMQTVATTTEAIVPALVGRWVSGAANLQDISGYTPAGTHDGTTMGATPSFYKFSPNVPPGFTGYSLDLTTNGQNCFFEDGSPMTNENGSQLVGQVAVPIGNSANNAPGYLNTFDNPLSVSCTISFWAQGVPGGWQPFVTKHGEDGVGYQVRRAYNNSPAFTVRGTSNQDGIGYGDITTNAAWYHVAAVRDAVTGIRKMYVNGVLHLNLTGDTAVGTLAPGQRFVIGGMERNGWTSGYFSGMLYDVRVYNYPLNQTQVNALLVPEIPVPTLGIQAAANGQIVISWPTASTGYVLQTNMALPGVWGNSTLPVSVVGSMNTVTNTVGAGANFYRLIK